TANAAVQSSANVQYKWYADNVNIGTGNTYTLAQSDIGKSITVVINAVDYADTLSSLATITVAKRKLTITATAENKTYNGSTDATVHFTFANTVNGDNVTATANAAFATKTAEDNKKVTLSNFALDETSKTLYSYAIPQNPTANITPKAITVNNGTIAISKTYDGTNVFTAANAVGSLALEQPVQNDDVSAEITNYGNANNADVGDKTLTLSFNLSGNDAKNYTIAQTSCTVGAEITKKPLASKMVMPISAVTYTGSAQTPQITLTDSEISKEPVPNGNYTVQYNNNLNAGTATVTITAKGNYSGELTTNFTINKAPSATNVTVVKAAKGKIFATHNDTLTLSAKIDGTQNGTTPSGSVKFLISENSGSFTAIKGAEDVAVNNGMATFAFKNPPVGTLSFKAEFTATDNSNYTSSNGTTAPYNIDKGEQSTFGINVPNNVTYGDSFTVSTNGGSVPNGVTYQITAGSDVVSIDKTSGTVTTLKSGTATIMATKAGNNSFNAITATTTITVAKAALQIKFAKDKQTAIYTGSEIPINAAEITLVNNEVYSAAKNGNIIYQYKANILQSWQNGQPTNAGKYTVRALLYENGNYLGGISENITLTIDKAMAQPTAIPTDLQAITNTQKTLATVPLPTDTKGTWKWKTAKTPLVADNDNKVQIFKAIFTPYDMDNYLAVEKDISIKVSQIVATFKSLDLATITEENGSAEISADIAIIGSALPTDGELELGAVVKWSNSAPNVIRLDTNNEGMLYKTTVTGLTNGISMVGIEVNKKPTSSVLVKYAPKNGGSSNNVAKDIDNATDVVNNTVTNIENLTDTEKAVVNSLADELLKLSPKAKENLAASTIESLNKLIEKAQNITTQSTATVDPSVENPIDTKKIEVSGMALASGSTANNKVGVNIKQQSPTQSQDGKQATLEFSMEMTVNGKPQQLKSPLLITLPLPKGINTKDMVIRHTKQDGTAEDLTYSATLSSGHYTIKSGSITMWVNSFSTFTFMIAKNAVSPGTPPISEEKTDYENEFWISVVTKIQAAKKGDVLKINTGAYIKMPACVMEELRIKGAGIVIKWSGGKDIVIPAGKAHNAEKNKDFWTLAELSELYKNHSIAKDLSKTNPKTGAETYSYVDNKTGETTPVTGNIVDATTTQGSQMGNYILVIVASALVAAITVFGVCVWLRKKKSTNRA
ncbi:MAG: YDG domain-containing protein, partial [Christensenella sp.]